LGLLTGRKIFLPLRVKNTVNNRGKQRNKAVLHWNILIIRLIIYVNKMLKTAKKLFTITSFTTGGYGGINSKFEAQNKYKKGNRWEG